MAPNSLSEDMKVIDVSERLVVGLMYNPASEVETEGTDTFQNKAGELEGSILKLPGRNKDDLYSYLLKESDNTLFEVFTLDSKYPRSWLVGNFVVGGGKLYVFSEADPTFIALNVLAHLRNSAKINSFKISQIPSYLPEYPDLIHFIRTETFSQVLESLCTLKKGTEFSYEFNEEKILAWLQKKMLIVKNSLPLKNNAEKGLKECIANNHNRNGSPVYEILKEYINEMWDNLLRKAIEISTT